jgi:hypothetical protein
MLTDQGEEEAEVESSPSELELDAILAHGRDGSQ